jgi:hypothetical protein
MPGISKKDRRILTAVIITVVVVPFVAFFGSLIWGIHDVRAFCRDIQPNMPLAALPALADKHGISKRWINQSAYSERTKSWFFFVPVEVTFGDTGCFVYHNKSVVLSTKMYGADD